MVEELEAGAITLPDGFSMRPAQLTDAEAVCQLDDLIYADARQKRQSDPNELRSEWQSTNIRDLATSTRLVEDATGQVVAYAEVWDGSKPPVYPWLAWGVAPSVQDTNLAHTLLAWLETTAQRAIADCPPNARVALRTGSVSGYEPKQRALEANGFQQIRESYRMRIDMTTTPPLPQLPDNIAIRTYNHPDELDALIKADETGFRDHWGFVERNWEETRADWVHWLETSEHFDPAHFFLAIDQTTDEIAGISLCFKQQADDPAVAYVDSLTVLPPYRRRGLGLALLHHTFGVFWQLGRKSVALHVDGASLTGATRLYERAGMHIDQKSVTYEKLLRDGEELSTVAVE